MERMLVSAYVDRQPDDQKPSTLKALMGMYTLALMGRVSLSEDFSWAEFMEALLNTECVDHGEYVTLAPGWEKDPFVQKYGGNHGAES